MERNTRNKRTTAKGNLAKIKRTQTAKKSVVILPDIELSLSEYEIQELLNNSRQYGKLIGERGMSRHRIKVYHYSLTDGEIRVKMKYREIRLLATFWAWKVFNTGEPEVAEFNLKILSKILGSDDVNKIRQLVSDHECSKDLNEQEEGEDDYELPEEDFDTSRGR